MRTLGLDIGEKRIGLAMSDPSGLIAGVHDVWQRGSDRELVARLRRLIQEEGVEEVVLGLPRSLSGELGPQGRLVEELRAVLARSLPVPVESWDERFSTAAAERAMIAAGVRREKRRARRDAVAAAFMLQGYLDAQASRRTSS